MDLEASVRRFARTAYASGRALLRLTNYESLAVAQTEDWAAELGRAGKRFHGGNSIIANGIAPVAAIPTTTATLALVNPNTAISLMITRLGFWLGSGTAAAGATLFASVAQPVDASFPAGPSHATGYAASNAMGPTGPSTRAFWATAVTVPAASVWVQALSSFQAAAANVGQGDFLDDEGGLLIVPPRCVLGLGILSGAGTTPLYGISARWSELELELER